MTVDSSHKIDVLHAHAKKYPQTHALATYAATSTKDMFYVKNITKGWIHRCACLIACSTLGSFFAVIKLCLPLEHSDEGLDQEVCECM